MSMQAVDNTLGALFLGVTVSCMLFGVSALQVYYYYHYYPNDSLLHKVSVGFLCVLDTTHLCLSIASTYHYGVSGFGQHDGLDTIVWYVGSVLLPSSQPLYAYRVWLLSGYHNGMLGYIVVCALFLLVGAGVVIGGFGASTVNRWSDSGRVAWAIESSFAATTLIDIIISIAMCYYLRKGVTEESPLNSRIARIIQYTLSCGVFTSAGSVACLFAFFLMPNNLVFFALGYLLTRLYVNSFMAMMNSRDRARTNNSNSNSVFVLSNRSSSGGFVHSHGHSRSGEHVSVPVPPIDSHHLVSVIYVFESMHARTF
ncbi:hypothetical protein DFH08DRAFT_793045 [Mycena albidolilacea]|uniref:DUF6534 domain-containing protein n=1 Tax=Mycena albidolilacea TaxID=1033008 RepID=A0AAD7EAC4_9AGAR|nr:hypothetical protein DFH08DRAFT_793045 [Mycena albidolilacea]